MAKFCIFCGAEPENKNKEHVIPQWLSKHTGRFNAVCKFNKETTTAQIPFSTLTFPACTKCNEAFGKLEAAVKPILLGLMNGERLSAEQISLLLDWFDKIRVGMWLAELTLAKKVDEIEPRFHIADRMGKKDRMLIVERIKDGGQGIGLVGIDTVLFEHSPSAFALIIDDFIFTNASEYSLVDKRLGFPQISKVVYDENQNAKSLNVSKGRGKTAHPVVGQYQASPDRVLIYQPMFRAVPNFVARPEYNTEYVKEHSLDFDKGVGGIFYQRGDNQIKYLKPGQTETFVPRAQPEENLSSIIANTFDLQNYVLENHVDLKSSAKVSAQFWETLMTTNKIIAKAIMKKR